MKLPKIGIVVCTYLESNQRYLDECLKSVKNLNYDKELLNVIVVSSGDYCPRTGGYRNLHFREQKHYPEAINLGVASLDNDCTHYLLLNDDTVLTKNSLIKLAIDAQDHMAIFQPISNCDNGWRYHLRLQAGPDVMVSRFYRFDEWAGKFDDLMAADSMYPPGFIMVDYVCFYATLIPKKVWDIVGPMDPKFLTGQDDLDYCRRAREKGIFSIININSLIWHFGGVTADIALTPEIRKQNIDYFTQKWGLRPDY